MKLVLDATIPRKLVPTLKPVFGECVHVDLIGLPVPATDNDIGDYALKNDAIILTKDSDYIDALALQGFPPKVILLKTGTNSSSALADFLSKAKPKIEELEICSYGLLELYGL